jgi:hypothetical protein
MACERSLTPVEWLEVGEYSSSKSSHEPSLSSQYHSSLPDVDDLMATNVSDKFKQIRWGGGTKIVPGWTLLMDTFDEIHQIDQQRPPLTVVCVEERM